MDPDKELSRAAERLNTSLAREVIPPAPRPPQRPWFATALAAGALTFGVLGIVYIAATAGEGNDVTGAPDTTLPTPGTTSSFAERVHENDEHGLTVTIPEGWRTSAGTLAPALAPGIQPLYEVLSIGTFDMRPGGEHCDYLPETAMRDMEPTDVLVSIQFNDAARAQPWPDVFGPDSWLSQGPDDAVADCTDREDLDYRVAVFIQGTQGIVIQATFGGAVTEQTVSETYALINSIIVDPGARPEPYDPGYIQSWSIEYGPDWYRAEGSELMPVVGESITLATFPLRAGGDLCAHMPENALRDLGPGDALVTIFIGWHTGNEPWPDNGFDDSVFPATPGVDAHECAERPDLEIHWGAWFNAEGHYLLVAFGDEVSPERRSETWAILSSLRPERDVPASADRGVCVSTRPPVPGLVPPERWGPTPSDGDSVWYGTPDLWVPMRVDGAHQEHFSVWWSQQFTDPGLESRPELSVTLERLDRDAPIVTNEGPATNASTAQDGLFMIADVEFPTSGCWRVTGDYKGASLGFVVNVP